MLLVAFIAVSLLAACRPTNDATPEPTPDDTTTEEDTTTMEDNMLYTEGVVTAEVVYMQSEGNDVTGYLARPEAEGNYPAIILIHEWWGLNENIEEYARRFAQEGYVALAVDMYEGKVAATPEEAGQYATAVRENTDMAFTNLEAALTYLRGMENVDTERLASVGWCFGGQWSYEVAKNDLGVDASVMYYGRFSPEDDLEMMKTMIIGHFGEDDASIPVDDVETFRAKLNDLSGEHEIYIYPNAGHAFANADNEEAYDAEAAEIAWERTMDFLTETLDLPTEEEGLPETSFEQSEETGSWSGDVLVRGYPEVRTVDEPFCEEDCAEYEYVFFQVLQTTDLALEQFFTENEGNAYAGDGVIGLGCIADDQITYWNDSDAAGRAEYQVATELTAEIMAATAENPIALKLTKEEFTGGAGAPACYAHFTQVEKVVE